MSPCILAKTSFRLDDCVLKFEEGFPFRCRHRSIISRVRINMKHVPSSDDQWIVLLCLSSLSFLFCLVFCLFSSVLHSTSVLRLSRLHHWEWKRFPRTELKYSYNDGYSTNGHRSFSCAVASVCRSLTSKLRHSVCVRACVRACVSVWVFKVLLFNNYPVVWIKLVIIVVSFRLRVLINWVLHLIFKQHAGL